MIKLHINFDEIQKAAEDTEREAFDYFLDRETGDVIILSSEIIALAQDILSQSYDDDIADYEDVEPDEIPDIPEWMEDEIELALHVSLQEQDRYERIPERKPSDTYASMKIFAETLENRQLGELLNQALAGQGSFRKFKNILVPYPKERKLWYNFNAKAAKKEIEEWLASHGIEPETC
jgi:hypothetical protein